MKIKLMISVEDLNNIKVDERLYFGKNKPDDLELLDSIECELQSEGLLDKVEVSLVDNHLKFEFDFVLINEVKKIVGLLLKENTNMKLIRVCYGRKDTPVKDREYHLEGQTAVGTEKEFENMFPGVKFEVKEDE